MHYIICNVIMCMNRVNDIEQRYKYCASGEKLRVLRYIANPNVTRAYGVKPEGATQGEVL